MNQQQEQAAIEDEFNLNLDLLKKKRKKKKITVESKDQSTSEPVSNGSVDQAIIDSKEQGASLQVEHKEEEEDHTYFDLLTRAFKLIREHNPTVNESKKKTALALPVMNRVGPKKCMWVNFVTICRQLQRSPDHLMSFLLVEFSTTGSLDGQQRLVIRGKFTQQNVESLLKKYIVEYITCHMCKSAATTLTRDPITRLYFVHCSLCDSSRSVAPIKSGFTATTKADRKKETSLKS